MTYLDVKVRWVDLEMLPKLKSHYDLEQWTHITLFIRNQKVEIQPEQLDFSDDMFEHDIINNAFSIISQIIKPILKFEDFMHDFDISNRTVSEPSNSHLDYMLYVGKDNKNFRVFKRLAENNLDFKKKYYCLDWTVGDKILRRFNMVKYSGRDYVLYIRHHSRLKGINELFEDQAIEYSKLKFNYFELRKFYRMNKFDKYTQNNDEEISVLIDNLFFHGGAAVVYSYDSEDPHKYVEERHDEIEKKLKSIVFNETPNKKEKLFRLGFENDYKNLEGVEIFRKAVYHLPRSVNYLMVDVHNKMGNSLVQLYMNNNTLLRAGMVSIVYVGNAIRIFNNWQYITT